MKIPALIASSLLLSLSGAAFAAGVADSVDVIDPYVRAVPPGQPNSAAFMTLTSKAAEAHALVAAESAASKVVELHTHIMEEGMMKMRKVEKIDLPAGQPVSLQPGGLHVMLIGLQQELVPDQSVTIHLVFDDGSKKEVQAPVRKLQMTMGGPQGANPHGH
jgi:periplasmic copper chaperone A